MSLMGKNYITIPMSHSWERIMSFTPWVTHGIELCAFNVCKMPKSMHSMRPSSHRERLCLLPRKGIPVNYQMIGYRSHLHSLGSAWRGTLLLLHI